MLQPDAKREPLRGADRVVPGRVFINVDFVDLIRRDQGQTYGTVQSVPGGQVAVSVAYAALPTLYTTSPAVAFTIARVGTSSAGFGFNYLQARYDTLAGLALTVPQPLFGSSLSYDGVSGILERRDTMLDFGAHYTVNDRRWRFVVQGGPTYFRTTADMVDRVLYTQAATLAGANAVSITSGAVEVTGSTWGYHVGGDASYFVWRHVGFGGGVRFNRGRIQVAADPFTGGTSTFDVGSTRLLGGVRFRF
jgi:hypothetical protein